MMSKLRLLAVTLLLVSFFSVSKYGVAQDISVRRLLQIPDGCYPVSINPTTESIQTVCRGRQGWMPDGLQYFNSLTIHDGYANMRNRTGSFLLQDMRTGVGPVPWFENFYLPGLDSRNIPRPR